MSTLLYLDNHYVDSLNDLKRLVETAELGSPLCQEIRTAFCNEVIGNWLSEGNETNLQRALAPLNRLLPDDELLANLKKIFSGKHVEIEKPELSKFATIKSIKFQANGMELDGKDATLVIGDFKGNATLDVEFTVHESANYIYNVDLRMKDAAGRCRHKDVAKINMRTKEKTLHVKFSIPTKDIEKNAEVQMILESQSTPITISLIRIPKETLWFDESVKTLRFNDLDYKFIEVEGGSFWMGASDDDSEAEFYERPRHKVTLDSFAIGETQVTQALWKAVVEAWEWVNGKSSTLDKDPSYFKGETRPVESVAWNECRLFIGMLNQLTGKKFSLPTEAEWEYAARGGKRRTGAKYSGGHELKDVAWYEGNSEIHTHPVGQKICNELGLYDMSGNVWEWCEDWFDSSYYSRSSKHNPSGPSSGSRRVNRGGSYCYVARYCRVSCRDGYSPGDSYNDLGLRLVLRP